MKSNQRGFDLDNDMDFSILCFYADFKDRYSIKNSLKTSPYIKTSGNKLINPLMDYGTFGNSDLLDKKNMFLDGLMRSTTCCRI